MKPANYHYMLMQKQNTFSEHTADCHLEPVDGCTESSRSAALPADLNSLYIKKGDKI